MKPTDKPQSQRMKDLFRQRAAKAAQSDAERLEDVNTNRPGMPSDEYWGNEDSARILKERAAMLREKGPGVDLLPMESPPGVRQNKRNWGKKKLLGDGICQNPDCKKLDTRGLTMATKSGYLLCHSCISSSIIRDRLAEVARSSVKLPGASA